LDEQQDIEDPPHIELILDAVEEIHDDMIIAAADPMMLLRSAQCSTIDGSNSTKVVDQRYYS
jgi:hypothetical protein